MLKRTLLILFGFLLLATTAPAVAAQPFTPHSGLAPTGEEVKLIRDSNPLPIARLQIGKGSEITFFAMLGTPEDGRASDHEVPRDGIKAIGSDPTFGGRIHGISIGFYIPVGGLDPLTAPGIREANPHEMYYAFSRRGTDIPGILRETGKNRFENLKQGWAFDVAKPQVYNLFSCPLTEQLVTNAVNATGLPYSYTELSKGPHNWGLWYPEDPNSLFPTYSTNNGLATVGDAYFHVMLCDKDPMFSQTSVDVRLAYEESDDDVILGQGELYWQLQNIGDQISFMSWPFDSDMSGDNTWFWMLTVSNVHLYETLHIGTAWS